MANNNSDEQVDSFLNALGRMRDQTEEHLLAQQGYERRHSDTLGRIQTQAKKRYELELKVYKEIEAKLGKEKAISDKRNAMFQDQLASMERYIDSNNKIIKTSVDLSLMQRQQIASIKRSDEATNRLNQAQDQFVSNLGSMVKDITKGLGTFAVGLSGGATGFTTLNPLIDIVSNSMGALAKAIPFVGEAAAATIKAGAEASKFVLELMDKNIKAFQEVANSGGLVADGMEGVSRQFLESGMSLEGFKKSIRDNANDLAEWGKTVGGGADKFTKAVGMLTKSDGPLAEAGLELRKLGMTADDIGAASAGFLQQEIRLGRARNMNEKQLAEGTAKYAQELDALQKITGLSKEDLIKQRNEMMTDSRFGASMDILRETNETGAKAIENFALTIKDPELKRGFMDLASGAANTDAAKKALVQMGSTVPEMLEKLRNAKPENVAKVFDEVQTDLKRGAKDYVETFREAAAVMPDTKTLGNYTTLRDIMNKQNISYEEAIEVQKKQKAATGGLTEDAVKAQQNIERMGQEVWKMGNTFMPDAARAVNKFTDSLKDFVVYVNKLLGKGEPEGMVPGAAVQIQNGAVVGGAGGEGDAGSIMEAAREGAVTRSLAPKGKGSFNSARDSQSASSDVHATPTGGGGGSNIKLANISSKSGKSAQVNSEYAPQFQKLINYLDETGYEIRSLSGYIDRDVRNKPGVKSMHAHAAAIDINPDTNPMGSTLITDMPEDISAIAQGLGLGWGGNWRSRKDAMHFSAATSEGGSLLKARDGGIFDGPKSGYDVELHGREAIVPLNNVSKEPLSNMPGVDQLAGITQAMMQMMEDKFDAMIDRLSTGNDIQDKLLRNSMV